MVSILVFVQPDVSRDEVLFPLTGHRLSFVSSPESDYDIAGNRPGNAPRDHEYRAPPASWNKLARASSDPSIATMETAGVEVFPSVASAVSGVDVSSYGRDARHVSIFLVVYAMLLCSHWFSLSVIPNNWELLLFINSNAFNKSGDVYIAKSKQICLHIQSGTGWCVGLWWPIERCAMMPIMAV